MELDAYYRRTERTRVEMAREEIARAFSEFLGIPAVIVAAALLLALTTYLLDRSEPSVLEPLRDVMAEHVFGNTESTGQLLGAIAGSVITVTSITFSLLLLAVQQAAASMTHQVFDQFLRRQFNRIIFGFFIGLAVYALVTLATVNAPFNPVIGASVALTLSIVALLMLPVLTYKTIDQMRPVVIAEAVHDLTLDARERQLELIGGTRRNLREPGAYRKPVRTIERGFISNINIDAIEQAVIASGADVEVELTVALGAFVAHNDRLATIHTSSKEGADAVSGAVANAFHIERQRSLTVDPAFGIEQLHMIAWTSISTSKSNPAPGITVIRNLRDLMARWASEQDDQRPGNITSPVIYHDDVPTQLMDTFGSLLVVSTESMQHQSYAEVLRAFATTFDRLSPDWQCRAADVVLRSLAGLGDHILTRDLDAALSEMITALEASALPSEAYAVRLAQDQLRQSRGELHARGGRVPTG